MENIEHARRYTGNAKNMGIVKAIQKIKQILKIRIMCKNINLLCLYLF